MTVKTTAARMVRKTWAGPFTAGPLVHPVTVGDAILKLFQTIWRVGLIATIVGASLLLAIWVSVQMQPPPLSTSITSTAKMDVKTCGAERPLRVTFHNAAAVTIQDIAFHFTAREAGRSSNLVEPAYLHSDVIIPPGKTAELCWTAPALRTVEPGATVNYAIDISYASADPAA